LVRSTSHKEKILHLECIGAKVITGDMHNEKEIAIACGGATCIVSTLAGLNDVMIETQKILLNGAMLAGVP